MVSRKGTLATIALCVIVCGFFVHTKANYYVDTLFPIGLTGLNGTGGSFPPYSNVSSIWNDLAERNLIFSLGINCIGSQDAQPIYLTPAGLTKIPKSLLSKHNPLRRMK